MLPAQFKRPVLHHHQSNASAADNCWPCRLNVRFIYVSTLTVSLPLFAFVFCVVWSTVYDFQRATMTHCYVRNLLPSLSAAIGNYQPQRFVWQSCILLAASPRLWITGNYVLLYGRSVRRRQRRLIAYVACLCNGVENVALVGLSLFTSNEDYETHKLCFLVFIAASVCYMLLSYFVNKTSRSQAMDSQMGQSAVRLKRNLMFLNILSFTLAGYFFLRHNDRCEPYMYTYFALAEYVFVLSNMAFHMTAALDFHDQSVTFDWMNGFHMVHTGYDELR